MGTVNLGRVRDRVTGIEKISGNGDAGTIDTYRVSFESSNYYDFNVTNGRNGVGQIVSFSGDSDSRNNLIVRIVNNQDKVLALLVKSNSESEVNDGYMQASFKVEKTLYTEVPVDYLYGVTAYSPAGSQLFIATYKQSLSNSEPRDFEISFSSGFENCLNAWCILYYNDSSTGITVDGALSDSSTNPVQNKVVTTALNTKLALPATAPATRKVVTIDTNGAQDNVDGTELTTLMSNIVDSHGNKRFVEGDITMNIIEGITQTYGKWSLSGTHLMIVLRGNIVNGIALPSGTTLANVNLPNYINNKIISYPQTTSVEYKTFDIYNSSSGKQQIEIRLRKLRNLVEIQVLENATITDNRSFRIQFDLLIDSE